MKIDMFRGQALPESAERAGRQDQNAGRKRVRVVGLWLLFGLAAGAGAAEDPPLHQIQLPPGFHIRLFARNVPEARSLAAGPPGVVFAGSRRTGKVYALRDLDADGFAERVQVLAQGLNSPNGVAFKDGDLYVAEIHRILRFPGLAGRLDDPPVPEVVNDTFPKEAWHGWKFIRFGPDGLLYVPVGAPCNVCLSQDPRFASIMRLRPDGSQLEIFAHGVRNTVGFDWDPQTRELWFTDNGRDWLGDDAPPDELNHAPAPGLHFGFPFCHGQAIPDPKFGKGRDGAKFAAPALDLQAHAAALGMRFYTGTQFPEKYREQILIAEHGSWNRREKVGYDIVLVRVDQGRVTGSEVFARGWLQGGQAWGRPVDVEVMPDGSLLVSDDRADAVYRITYRP